MESPWFTASGTGRTIRNPSSYLPNHFTTQPNVAASIPGGRRRGGGANSFDISKEFEELEVNSQEDRNEKLVSRMTNKVTPSDDPPVEATGLDIPPPATSFSDMGFSAKALSDNIRRCKYVNPTPIQRYAIPVAMAGRDLMACAQTGSGKTAAFCFPIINGIMAHNLRNKSVWPNNSGGRGTAFPMALILAPTRELTCQIHEEAKKFSFQTGVKVVVAYGGAPIGQQLRNLEKGVDILVATPGRLVDIIERAKVSLRCIKYLALDEADRMLDMGFECQVRKIVQQMDMPQPGARQTMLFSATFPDKIQKLASDFLSNYIFISAGKVGSSTDLIVQKVEFVPDMDKRDYLVNLLRSRETNKNALTLVFVETKRGADALERWLSRKGFPSTAIHGDKIQLERERALKSFRTGRIRILVATDVAARGLDIPDVGHVINYDLPRVVDDYVHRIGRTGRAGKSGLATAFFSDKNVPLARPLVQLMLEANQQVPTWLTEYANNDSSYSHPYEASSVPITPVDFPYVADYSVPVADSFAPASYAPASYDYGYNYSSVPATGWD